MAYGHSVLSSSARRHASAVTAVGLWASQPLPPLNQATDARPEPSTKPCTCPKLKRIVAFFDLYSVLSTQYSMPRSHGKRRSPAPHISCPPNVELPPVTHTPGGGGRSRARSERSPIYAQETDATSPLEYISFSSAQGSHDVFLFLHVDTYSFCCYTVVIWLIEAPPKGY
jgi:hypothetical protein